MPHPLDWIDDELGALEERSLIRRRREITALPQGRCRVGERELVNFASNDYLDLAHDPRVIAAAREALEDGSVGAGASSLVSGRSSWHRALEERLARFEQQPASLLFPTGYAANVGTICALAGSNELVFSDRLNHASLIDGCRLSGAQVHVYRHDDLAELSSLLKKGTGSERQVAVPEKERRGEVPVPFFQQAPGGGLEEDPRGRRRLIVTDSVFSMDGDLAPLSQLCDLADRFDALLVIDEAHATGIFGKNGRGVAELQGVESRNIVRVGTLSKAIGAQGGFVAGPKSLIDWLWNRARTQMFSTALPPAVCAAAAAAIDIIDSEPGRRERLLQLADSFRRHLRESQIGALPNSAGPIVPIVLSAPERALEAARRLEDLGFLVAAIRPPTVPEGTSRLRISLSSGHSLDDIERLTAALRSVL
jgi:7-keto-8-aminopelargonate synthetase-like enzyme